MYDYILIVMCEQKDSKRGNFNKEVRYKNKNKTEKESEHHGVV